MNQSLIVKRVGFIRPHIINNTLYTCSMRLTKIFKGLGHYIFTFMITDSKYLLLIISKYECTYF